MESKNNERQEVVGQIYDYATDLMVNQKKSAEETINILIGQGLNKERASVIVGNLEQQIKDIKKKKANRDMLYGALWCGGGVIVTVVTYSNASSGGGGSYVIAWGAILFGAIQFIKGFINGVDSAS
jgi:hypothetical protein